jgi:hypothetical protein
MKKIKNIIAPIRIHSPGSQTPLLFLGGDRLAKTLSHSQPGVVNPRPSGKTHQDITPSPAPRELSPNEGMVEAK